MKSKFRLIWFLLPSRKTKNACIIHSLICSLSHSCSEEEEDEEEYLDNAAAAEAVKSSRAKYIEEEQEVLANINLVKAMKQKFAR